MMIVRYIGANDQKPNGDGEAWLINGMEGLLTESAEGYPQVVWREILIRTKMDGPWRPFMYRPAVVEFGNLQVIGYADDLIAWKQQHNTPPAPYATTYAHAGADLSDPAPAKPTSRRDK